MSGKGGWKDRYTPLLNKMKKEKEQPRGKRPSMKKGKGRNCSGVKEKTTNGAGFYPIWRRRKGGVIFAFQRKGGEKDCFSL